jgi:hypothetical protein
MQPRVNIMVCELAGAALRGNLPPGWLAHDLFIAASPAAHTAVALYVASSCVTQRAVAEVSFIAPSWVHY